MSNGHQNQATLVDPLLVPLRVARQALGNASETTFREWVDQELINIVYCGKKALVPYAAVKELARRIEAGDLAPARSAFRDHDAAIKKSIESRRRRAQARTNATPAAVTAKHRAPASEPPDPPDWPGRRP
jgi:hypothetical protein